MTSRANNDSCPKRMNPFRNRFPWSLVYTTNEINSSYHHKKYKKQEQQPNHFKTLSSYNLNTYVTNTSGINTCQILRTHLPMLAIVAFVERFPFPDSSNSKQLLRTLHFVVQIKEGYKIDSK
jgi:hypothetical protein